MSARSLSGSMSAVLWLGLGCTGPGADPAPVEAPSAPRAATKATPTGAENAPEAAQPAGQQPQHVVLITVDTLRADSVVCTDAGSRLTPNICALAQKGRRFTHAISPAPATLPALTAIFTHSQVANESPPTLVAHYDAQTTLAQKLQAAGLQTAAFTDHHGLGYSQAVPVFPPGVIQRGLDVFENFGKDRRGVGASQVTDAAIAWLDAHSAAPYFLWAHYFDPHFNYRPDPAVAAELGFSKATCGRIQNGMDITEIRDIETTLSPAELTCLKTLHEAEIKSTDAAIGRLLAALPTEPAPLILFASDHGEEFLDRNRVGHEWTVYNVLIHVPFIAVGPGIPVEIETRAVSTLELHSLATGAPVSLTGAVYSRANHYYGKSPDLSKVRQRANEHTLVTDHEKVILHPDGRVERFDLRADPGERSPIATVEPLLGQLQSTITALTVAEQSPSPSAIDRDRAERERLRSLGYVE